MSDKPTRGRIGKINLLPGQIKEQLDAMLRDGRLQQKEILDIINGAISSAGLPADSKISRTGLNRYSQRMESVGSRIRQAREVSQQWIAKMGTEPEGDLSKILVEMIRTLAFEAVLSASQGSDPIEPKFVKDLAMGIEKLEKAASESHKREFDIRKRVAEEAALVAEASMVAQGMSKKAIKTIKDEILGMTT